MDFRQWEVGNDVSKKEYNLANYKYDANPGAHGRYYEYDTPNGKVVIVEHTSDGVPHYHAGRAKPGADPFTYDFKNNRYQNIAIPDKNEHIYYGN